ncbi:hypothetical protein [Amycolatopsis rifamycinica]|uniref:Uncharacterized protein n=1 Tax=Amycolatopsis rifamycinica TaxID=287986 RepID=A0A066TP56_9PSEU|nr:hypothetical protein [Amycolatopsis rifamycinica]KDN16625.1 hypothetical protein DV20_39590 [Amycolatopsis rifamycinica]
MSGRPTWGSAAVTGLAGFATGLLVAAVLVAGRSGPRPADAVIPPTRTVSAVPVTVTTSAPPSTLTSVETSPPTTTTSLVEVTVQATTSVTPTSATSPVPLTSIWRD